MARELKEELLNPRYKVIADFPQWSVFAHKLGDVLELRGIHFVGNGTSKSINEKDIDKYPSVLRKLEWWEEREEKDLPEYLKSANSNTFYKVLQYNVKSGDVWVESFNGISLAIIHFVPATKEEYKQYQKSHK